MGDPRSKSRTIAIVLLGLFSWALGCTKGTDSPKKPSSEIGNIVATHDGGDGVTDTELLLGQTAAYSGPLSPRVVDAWRGAMTAFSVANDQGGVNGRKIKLVLEDDAYDPEKARAAVLRLFDAKGVFALFGGLGASVLPQTLPVLRAYHDQRDVFAFSYLSGPEVLIQKPNVDVYFTTRATYEKEAIVAVEALVSAGKKRFGGFFRAPSFSHPGYEKALKAKGLEFVLVRNVSHAQTWESSTAADVAAFRAANVDAIIAAGPNQPCTALIRDARKSGMTVPIALFSFADPDHASELLLEEQRKSGAKLTTNIITTTIVPLYSDTSIPLVSEYRRAIDKYKLTAPVGIGDGKYRPSSPYNFDSLEGYLNATLFLRVLEKNGRALTRKSFYEAAEAMGKFDVGLGVPTEFSASRHQAVDQVWVVSLTAEGWKPLGPGAVK